MFSRILPARKRARFTGLALAAFASLALLAGGPAISTHADGAKLFISSAVEHANDTATFPLHRGTSGGKTVYYIVLDTSSDNLSSSLGVNRSQKLANAANTGAVQKVTVSNGVVNFPATVTFGLTRTVVPGP